LRERQEARGGGGGRSKIVPKDCTFPPWGDPAMPRGKMLAFAEIVASVRRPPEVRCLTRFVR
jgi:hypothetical protein